jgi:uncharacterized membrane protein YkvA (DUF1232 family)
MENFKKSLRALKSELAALYFAYRDPRTPWYAKVAAFLVIAYALSPIDLIPDFIPLLGYLDDLIIVPLGIFIAIKLIPAVILVSAREKAASSDQALPTVNVWGIVIILFLWLVGLGLVGWLIWRLRWKVKGFPRTVYNF